MNSSFGFDIISRFKDMLSQYSNETAKVFYCTISFLSSSIVQTKGYILSLPLNIVRKLCNPLFLATIFQLSLLIAVYQCLL